MVAVDRVVLATGRERILARNRRAADVLGQLDGDRVRERDRPDLPSLRLGDLDLVAHDPDLLLDVELSAEEVDVADTHAERLALAEAASGGDDSDRPVALGHRIDDPLDPLDGPRKDLGAAPLE